MNLKGLDETTRKLLEDYLDGVAVNIAQGNFVVAEELFALLRCSVGRIAANELRRGERAHAIPEYAEVRHVADWLVVSLVDEAAWLRNVDERGRPKKLMKCGTVADLLREADRYFEKHRGQMARALGPEDEEHVDDIGGGYSIVRMLTPEALDFESLRMHHCLGAGGYDMRVFTPFYRYLSVRDGKRRPVATIELRQESNGNWWLIQIAGKRNATPSHEIMNALRDYVVAQCWRGRNRWWPTVTMADGSECEVDRIPEGATIAGLDEGLRGMDSNLRLPANLTVLEGLYLSPLVRIPENLTVSGIIQFTRGIDGDPRIVLPESLLAKEIRVCSAEDLAQPIPAHLVPRISVRTRKMTGYAYLPMVQTDEVQGPDDEDDDPFAPRP